MSENVRELSKLISRAENGDPKLYPQLAKLYPKAGNANVLGITGLPGAGKSTLINELITRLRKKDKKVAVIAVDPMSPMTGGALLGDRIRFANHYTDPNVYIRSLSTRGRLGGLSQASREVMTLLDAAGFDWILIETVGVGQSEVDVLKIADMTIVVLVPEAGDAVQVMKAGVLEIGDLYLVNKADREGAEKIALDLKTMLEISKKNPENVMLTSLKYPETMDTLFEKVTGFYEKNKKEIVKKRARNKKESSEELLQGWIRAEAKKWTKKKMGAAKNPYEVIQKLIQKYPSGPFRA